MGYCKYCGKEAGFLQNQHPACAEKYEAGRTSILQLARSCAIKKCDLFEVSKKINAIARDAFISPAGLQSVLVDAWEQTVRETLANHLLSREEEDLLSNYKNFFGLDQDDLDKNGVHSVLVKAAVLREITEGKIPDRLAISGNLPSNFQKDETLVWLFREVKYYEPRLKFIHPPSYQGAGIDIAKGVYYPVGGFKGRSIGLIQNVRKDSGFLGISNKNLYFSGKSQSLRLEFSRIGTFSAYEDGIAIRLAAPNARTQIFKTGDGWFTYNLLMSLAKVAM